MILDLVLNFHAWSTARPEFETAHAGDTLMDEAQRVLATEREQGTSLFSFGMKCYRPTSSSSSSYSSSSSCGSYYLFALSIHYTFGAHILTNFYRFFLSIFHRAKQTSTPGVHSADQDCACKSHWVLALILFGLSVLKRGAMNFASSLLRKMSPLSLSLTTM